MTTTEILEKIAVDNGFTIGDFCSYMGFKATYTYDVTHFRTKSISSKVAREIVGKFPQYRVIWLMTGEGEPYTEEYLAKKEVKEKKTEVEDLRDQIDDLRKQITEKDKLIAQMVADKAEADREYRRQISGLVATITNQASFGRAYGSAEPVPHPHYDKPE